jgi:predicted ATPase
MNSETRKVLEIAAAMGPEFAYHPLRRFLRMDEETLADLLIDAAGEGLIKELPGERFVWLDEAARESLYAGIAPARRPNIHRRLLEAMTATLGEEAAKADPSYERHRQLSRSTFD